MNDFYILLAQFFSTLKSATKPFNVHIACTRPLITGLSEKLSLPHHFCLQHPLTPQCDLRQYAVSYP